MDLDLEFARRLHEELNGRHRARENARKRAREASPSRTYRPVWPQRRVAVASGGRSAARERESAREAAREGARKTTDARAGAADATARAGRSDGEGDGDAATGTSARARGDDADVGARRERARLRKNELSKIWHAKMRAARAREASEGETWAVGAARGGATVAATPRRSGVWLSADAGSGAVGAVVVKSTSVRKAQVGAKARKMRREEVKGGKGSAGEVTVAAPSETPSVAPATPPPIVAADVSATTKTKKKMKGKSVALTGPSPTGSEANEKQKRKYERRPDSRFIKCKDAELTEFPPGVMVWVRLSSSHKGQWWPGRTWKLRQCAKAYDLLDTKPEGARALVKLFGSHSFEWAAKEDLAPYDAQRQTAYRENMLQWYTFTKAKKSRQMALKALRQADAAEIEEWSDPWSTSEDSSSESEEETEAVATMRANEQALESMKVGLTPDWIVHAACRVFELDLPTIEAPLIKGLLDPCTNSHLRPNIPAEKCYDKQDDGLKMENSWEGYHVLVNPPYEAQVQWRFINRAINEVEWERCPGIILVCRNSTDTSYFQRLLPFPRIHLRRTAVQFKDYRNCPIGFGICVFCIVSPTHPKQAEIYHRFYDEFHAAGEFNIPVDGTFVKSPPFIELTTRLHRVACEAYRDSWIACDVCDRWREIPFDEMLKARKSKVWQCRDSFPLGCQTPLTRSEIAAFSVAKAEQNTVLVASKVEGWKGPVGLYAAETLLAGEADATGEAGSTDPNGMTSEPDRGEEADDERDADDERTREFVESGGKLHGLGCPCNWAPCCERRAKENKILSKTFPGLRLEWEKIRDELTNALTPFEKERLEKIEANKNKLRSLMRTSEEQKRLASHKVVHASAAESAALRMWDIAKRKQKTKVTNAERRERKVASLKKQLQTAEKRLGDIMSDVREANHGVDTALKVLQAIRSRASRVQNEFERASDSLKTVRDKCKRLASAETRAADDVWTAARARLPSPDPRP